MAVAGQLEILLLANVARLQSDMTQAKGAVGSAMKSIESSVAMAKSALGALGISLGVGYFVSLIKGSIDAADHLKDLGKSTNIVVEDLAGLRLLAKQTGTDLDGLAKGINKMSVEMGKDPDKFVKLGVTAKGGTEALKQLADIFNMLPDINQRNALAQKIFSKSWAELAPALSEGGRAIGETIEKGTRLSGITKEMTDEADKFNDKWAELVGTGGLLIRLVGPMLPMLNDLADDMLKASEKTDDLNTSFSPLADTLRVILVLGANVSFVFTTIGKELAGMKEKALLLNDMNFEGAKAVGKLLREDAAKARAELDAYEAKIMGLGLKGKTAGWVSGSDLPAGVDRSTAEAAAIKATEFLKDSKEAAKLAAAELKLYEGAMQSLEQELGKLNDQTQEQKTMYQLLHGSLQKLSFEIDKNGESHAGNVLQMAREVDAMKRLENAAKNAAALDARILEGKQSQAAYDQKRGENLILAYKNNEQMEFETTLIGKTNTERETAIALRSLENSEIDKQSESYARLREKITAAIADKNLAEEGKRQQVDMWQSIDRTAHDTWTSIFNSGKSAFDRLRDTLKNGLYDLLYQMTIKKWLIQIVASTAGAGVAQSAFGSTTGSLNALSTLNSAYSSGSGLLSMGLTGMADYAAGFATTATASQAAAAAMIESGTAGFAGAGMEAGAGAGMGFSAAIPYVGAAVLAMYALGVFDSDEREKVLIGTGVTGKITRGGLQGSLASNWGTGPNDRWGGTTLSELPAAALATINNTINNVFTNMTDAAKKMGLSVADLSDIVVDFTTSSQNGDQTANDLNAALAATSDAIALKLIPNIQSLQYQGESLTQTFARLAAAQAALDAQKRTMEIALMEAQGKAVEALAAKREDELKALNATLQPLQKMINAAQDLSTAFTDAQTAAQNAVSGQLDSARSLSQAFQQVTKSINDSITQLRGGALSPLTSAQKYADARQQLGAAFAASSGDAEMTAKLPGLVNTFLAASRDMNSSSAAYTKDYEKAMSMLNRAAEFSVASVSEQDTLIATLTDLSTAIQDAAKNDENVALLREISDKLSNGGTGNAGTFLAQLVALNGTAETRKAAEDAAHAKALVDDQSSISRLAAQIENARQTIGSVTDPSAVSYYQREIELWEATLAKARTDYLILSGGIPSHASGLSTVPYDNYLMKAHAGEAVLTRSQASDWRSGSQGITSEDLRALRADVQRLTAIVAAGDHANVQATERVAQTQENAAWREEVRPRVN